MSEERPCVNPEYAYELKWYYWPRCSLLPVFKYRPANKHSCADISFTWLVFRAWTNISPQLGVEIMLDESLQIRLNLPYLHTGIFIPLFPYSHRFWRVPKRDWSAE